MFASDPSLKKLTVQLYTPSPGSWLWQYDAGRQHLQCSSTRLMRPMLLAHHYLSNFAVLPASDMLRDWTGCDLIAQSIIMRPYMGITC